MMQLDDTFLFDAFQQSWKVYKHSVCLSVHDLVLVNILRMSENWYMLVKFIIECSALKMVDIGLIVRVEIHKRIPIHYGREKILPSLYCTKYNETDTSLSDLP